MTHKIFVVEDHPIMREGLASLIRREPDLDYCGEATTGLEALDKIPDAAPDLVLIDIAIPEMNGIELIKNLRERHPDLSLLVVSAHEEALYAERALRAGAQGYVMKREAVSRVIDAIRAVLQGQLYMSDRIRDHFIHQYLGLSDEIRYSPLEQLSDRELEVFHNLGKGLSTREIAEAMLISPKTVETYRTNIKNKLGLSSSAEVIQRAVLWVDSNAE